MSLEIIPVKQADVFEFINRFHRHHQAPVGWLWGHGVQDERGVLVGVATVGRPIARSIDDGLTCEVTRLCTDGTKNACSSLYSASRRTAIAKGYRRGLTYIREDEPGTSLRAAGWEKLWETKGRSWSCPSRPREDKTEIFNRIAYGWGAWPVLLGTDDE